MRHGLFCAMISQKITEGKETFYMKYLGIDLGGINVAAAVVDEGGTILSRGPRESRCRSSR